MFSLRVRILHPLPVILLLLLFSANAFSFSFANKKALVTGSSGGIGAAIAKELAAQGCRIIIHYHTRYEGAKQTRQDIINRDGICDGMIQCDFRDPNNISSMMKNIDEIWNGELDILINNAGLITKLAAEDEDDDFTSWMDTIQVNLNAPYQLSKLAHERMKRKNEDSENSASGGGVIINNSSIHGSIGVEYMTAYATSKAGMDRMTKGLALEWAKDNVRVNAVAPGVVPVERTALLHTQEMKDLWHPHLPVGRMGTVEEVAHAVKYLCENEWTTGTVLTLDGGMTARSNMPIRPKPKPTLPS